MKRSVAMMPLAMIMASVSACSNEQPRADPKNGRTTMTTHAATLEDLGRELGLAFPPSSRLLGAERDEGMDDLVRVKIVMPRAEWAMFVKTSPVQPEVMDPGTRGFLGPDHGWWDPNRAPGIRTGQAQLPGARYLNIGVDDDGGPVVTVYIVNHGT